MKPTAPKMCSNELNNAWRSIFEDEERLINDLSPMIEIDTSFPPGAGYVAFTDLMENLFTSLGFKFERVVVPTDLWQTDQTENVFERVNLIATHKEERPPCSVYFHMDTVPAGDGWSWPPFALSREDNRLYGRGTADMKGAIVATLVALRVAEKHDVSFRFSPRLLFCTDEEGGLFPGIRYLAEKGAVKGHLLCLNGSAMPRIWAGCFGSVDLRVRLFGRGAHSGAPERGINAVEESVPVLTSLLKLKRKVESRVSAMPPPPHHGESLRARLTVASFVGGQKGSSLPGEATILINRRYCSEEAYDDIRKEIEQTIDEAVRKTSLHRAETQIIGHLVPVQDPTGPHWFRWQSAMGAGFGFSPDEFSAWGASTSSDMGFVQEGGIREILLGGLSRPNNNVHAPDEFTTLDDLKSLAASILLYFSRDFEG